MNQDWKNGQNDEQNGETPQFSSPNFYYSGSSYHYSIAHDATTQFNYPPLGPVGGHPLCPASPAPPSNFPMCSGNLVCPPQPFSFENHFGPLNANSSLQRYRQVINTQLPSQPSTHLSEVSLEPKRQRAIYTSHQLEIFDHAYKKNKYISMTERNALAARLNVFPEQVRIWFQNRRAREKRRRPQTEQDDRLESAVSSTAQSTDVNAGPPTHSFSDPRAHVLNDSGIELDDSRQSSFESYNSSSSVGSAFNLFATSFQSPDFNELESFQLPPSDSSASLPAKKEK